MTTKKYRLFASEIDGEEQAYPTEIDIPSSDMLLGFGGIVGKAATTVTSNSVLALTATSNSYQTFTGSVSGQILRMPDATTLPLNMIYEVWNFSTSVVTVQNSASTLLAELRANSRTTIYLRDNSTAAGIWALTYTLDNGNTFGTSLEYVEANAETSNNSQTTWVNKLTLTTSVNLAYGDYLLNFQFMWRAANANRNLNVRIQKDSVDVENWQPFTANLSDRPIVAGFYRFSPLSGAHTITLDFRVGTASGSTVYMSNARMFLWRIK